MHDIPDTMKADSRNHNNSEQHRSDDKSVTASWAGCVCLYSGNSVLQQHEVVGVRCLCCTKKLHTTMQQSGAVSQSSCLSPGSHSRLPDLSVMCGCTASSVIPESCCNRQNDSAPLLTSTQLTNCRQVHAVLNDCTLDNSNPKVQKQVEV